jgi:type IV pilus assembly protein PilC
MMTISDFFVAYWWLIFGVFIGSFVGFFQALKRSPKFRDKVDALSLKLPVFGPLIEKATVAKWSRTFSAMFAAGVPMVETLDSVAGAAGNAVYRDATQRVRIDVAAGASLASSLQVTQVFPNMLNQMVAIGEESGSLDAMVDKVADFFEREVDEMVDQLSSLMEPMIMVVLGSLIGTIVVAMYLPIFKLGTAF